MDENKRELFERLFDGCNPRHFREFRQWVNLNRDIYYEFVRLAYEYKNAGNSKCSGWLLANVIRWNKEISGTGEFKIKNLNIAYLTRFVILKNPDLDGFFTLASFRG